MEIERRVIIFIHMLFHTVDTVNCFGLTKTNEGQKEIERHQEEHATQTKTKNIISSQRDRSRIRMKTTIDIARGEMVSCSIEVLCVLVCVR